MTELLKKLGVWQLVIVAFIVVGSIAGAAALGTLIPFYIICGIVLIEVLYLGMKTVWEHL